MHKRQKEQGGEIKLPSFSVAHMPKAQKEKHGMEDAVATHLAHFPLIPTTSFVSYKYQAVEKDCGQKRKCTF